MEISLLRSLVWLDFRLAVLFTVFIPLGLLAWAFKAKVKAVWRSLVIYWRVSLLLAITVYLLMAELPIGFVTGWVARILVPLSLWYWQDLNEDIGRSKGILPLVYTAWRWAMVVYCIAGTVFGTLFVGCGFSDQPSAECQVLLEAPMSFKSIFLGGASTETLAFFAIVGLLVYGIYFTVFAIFNLPKSGRIAFRD